MMTTDMRKTLPVTIDGLIASNFTIIVHDLDLRGFPILKELM